MPNPDCFTCGFLAAISDFVVALLLVDIACRGEYDPEHLVDQAAAEIEVGGGLKAPA
jgi:hypothetical protein